MKLSDLLNRHAEKGDQERAGKEQACDTAPSFEPGPVASSASHRAPAEPRLSDAPVAQGGSGGVADIVFLLDVTGSMQPCIDALKNNIAAFLGTLSERDGPAPVRDWRARVVGYRDYNYDDAPPLEVFPFVRSASLLQKQLAALEARGGGDEEESLLDALYKVASCAASRSGEEDAQLWRSRADAVRIVVVFTDAPYRQVMSLPEARGGTVQDVANLLMSERIVLSVFAPDMPCYDMLAQTDKSEYHPVPYDLGDDYGPQKALALFTSRPEAFRQTLMQLARSISKSAETPVL